MSNFDNKGEYIYYVERSEISPPNDNLLYLMDKKKITDLCISEELRKTADYVLGNYTVDNSNFKTKINESVVLINQEALKFLKKVSWRSNYETILTQTLLPIDTIDYFVINYINKTNTEMHYNHFIITIRIEKKKVPEEFYKIFENGKEIASNKLLIQFLKTMMKYDFEEMNNLCNSSDENMEISTRISSANTNYLTQKMIEQPDFLKNKLYLYQRSDINFMLEREKGATTKKYILDEKRVVNWGNDLQCIFDKVGDVETCNFIPVRTIHNYKGQMNSFCGGCLCNSPGLGKTLEILTLCGMNPSINLIIVPEHLFEHWIFEYNKHIEKKHITLITSKYNEIKFDKIKERSVIILTTYNTLTVHKNLVKEKYTRLIIDEFHELFDSKDKTYPLVHEIKSEYKWAITATPFINSMMIHNILNFVALHKIISDKVQKYKMYLDIFAEMFRKNTKESVKAELSLPKINQKTYVLTLSEIEKTMLYSICNSAVDKETLITRQMAFCINPNVYFQDGNGVSEKFIHVNICEAKVINMHQEDYEKIFKKIIKEKIKYLKLDITNSQITNFEVLVIYDFVVNKIYDKKNVNIILEKNHKELAIKPSIDSLDDKEIERLWDKYLYSKIESKFNKSYSLFTQNNEEKLYIIKLENDLKKTKSAMVYFEQQIKLINEKTKTDSETENKIVDYEKIEEVKETEIICSICLGDIDSNFTLLQCGHSFCTDCLRIMLSQTSDKCPQCNFSLRNTTFYTPQIVKKENIAFEELIKKYGTKIAHLINICKNIIPHDKTIIYCDSPALINNLDQILNENGVSSISATKSSNIMDVVENFRKDKQTLVLSSEFNASGLNIQFAKSIIILQPIRGDYARVKEIENQIIGRIHRIGQTSEVNLIRLIIKNSIESEIIRQNKIIDTEFSSSNFKSDFPTTDESTIEVV